MTRALELQELARLTAAVFSMYQSRMGVLRLAEQLLRTKLAGLDTSRRTRALSLTEADPALQAGADLLWQSWIEQRRAALNAELSRNLVSQESVRAALGRAFGRDQATRGLYTDARRDLAKAKTRRDDFSS